MRIYGKLNFNIKVKLNLFSNIYRGIENMKYQKTDIETFLMKRIGNTQFIKNERTNKIKSVKRNQDIWKELKKGGNQNHSSIQSKYKSFMKKRKRIHFETLPTSSSTLNQSKVAILIPYRNREEHLQQLRKHFQNSSFDFYVVEQKDTQKFNRGILLNIAYDLAKKNGPYDFYIFHDVDSLPDQDLLPLYSYQGDSILHFASPHLGYKYSFPDFLGGVIGMKGELFEKINGFPNTIYGWGGEDDIMYNRIANQNIKVYRPSKGSYLLLEHPQATEGEKSMGKWEGILKDVKNWKRDGYEQIDSNYVVYSMKVMEDPKMYFYEVRIPFLHFEDNRFLSLMKPLLTWKEVKEEIIETYTEPNSFKKKNQNEKNSFEWKKEIEEKVKQSYEKDVTKQDLEETLKFIFDTYREILYIRIRQNGIEHAYHIYNRDYENRWSSYIHFPDGMNVNSFSKKRNQNLHANKAPIAPSNKWTGNNCVVSLENWLDEGNPTEYVKEIYEMIYQTIVKYKQVPDCDLFINRKDFQYLHQDKTRYAYTSLFPENVKIPDPPQKYWMIFCQNTTDHNKDIPIPSADDWRNVLSIKKNNKNQIKWNQKENQILFRGRSTGCSITEVENPRLRLSKISQLIKNPQKIDVGLSSLVKKVKVNDFTFGYIDYNQYKSLLRPFLTMKEQEKAKYILNIEGNAAAYRYGGLFNMNSVVIQTESKYKMWFEGKLKEGREYIKLEKEVFMKEGDTIEDSTKKMEKWIDDKMKKNKEMEEIAQHGKEFFQQYLKKDSILNYWFECMLCNHQYIKK